MRDYPLDFNQLISFSESNPYLELSSQNREIKQRLEQLQETLNFPAITDDIGNTLRFLINLQKPKKIFEMGSGYGHSAFWYCVDELPCIEKIILTEKRDDLEFHFNSIPWSEYASKRIEYFQDDAFKYIQNYSDIDFVLIDGVKADYKKFLELCIPRLNKNALVVIDNSYWRGSFLDEDIRHKKESAQKIYNLHEYIKNTDEFVSLFLPFKDGLSLLLKK